MSSKEYKVKKILLIWSKTDPYDVELIRMINAHDKDRMITCPTKETLVSKGQMPRYVRQIPSLIFSYTNGEISIEDDFEKIVATVHELLGLIPETVISNEPLASKSERNSVPSEKAIMSRLTAHKTPPRKTGVIGKIHPVDKKLMTSIMIDFPKDNEKKVVPLNGRK